MAIYSKLRTPYVEISIGDATGKNMTVLPPQLARLVEKVEIQETLCCNGFNQINITFNEGSREPFPVSVGSFASQELYPLGNSTSSALSNQSGLLVDLRMPKSGGITAIPAKATAAIKAIADIANVISGFLGKDNSVPSPEEKEILVTTPAEANITYLFQPRNQVKVVWGYKEDPLSTRSVRGYILVVTSDFPEKGTPSTTVVAHESAAIADQIIPKKAKSFSIPQPKGLSESLKPIFEEKDLSISIILREMALKMGIDAVVSDKFDTTSHDAGVVTLWSTTESLHQFLSRLSTRYDAVYKMMINPITGKDTIVFLSEKDWSSIPIISTPELMTYRGANSILKSVNIKADYGFPVGALLESVQPSGKKVTTNVNEVNSTLFEGEKPQNNFPKIGNTPGIASGAENLTPTATGTAIVTPESSPENQAAAAKVHTNKSGDNLIALEFSTLGYTRLTPGTVKFSGIGHRYTGYYSIHTVTHTIDSSGYNCKGMATSFSTAQGGVNPVDNKAVKVEKQVGSGLFKAATPVNLSAVTAAISGNTPLSTGGNAKAEYDKKFVNNNGSSAKPDLLSNSNLGIKF